MSESTDDLEQTLVLAAAAADSRQYEEDLDISPENVRTTEKIHYYTEAADSEESNEPQPTNFIVSNAADNISSHSNRSNIKQKHEEPLMEPSKKSKRTESSYNPEPRNRGSKRHHEEDISRDIKQQHVEVNLVNSSEVVTLEGSHSKVVATHYNLIEDKGLDERSKSRIVYMRNFHNWIKSMLINEYLTKIKDLKRQHNPPIRVHDMCCGKGGDLLKWKKGNISHLICSDIAEVSLEHCKQRYDDMKQRSQNERGWNAGNLFSMELVHGDGGKVRLREKYLDPSIKLDLVSCQFAFHYSFESLQQAECMMKNASECLLPGGYFIGTIPDSNEIIARARKSESGSFGNDVFKVTLDFDLAKPPLFGGKYNFQLDGVVNCPEFLVHFPTFVKLAKKYGLKLVKKEKFWEFFERLKDEGRQLLGNMRALESFPPNERATLAGDAPDDYVHAKEFVQKQQRDQIKIGTLSKSEWEASSLYLTFVFEKVKNTWNADGTPCYDI